MAVRAPCFLPLPFGRTAFLTPAVLAALGVVVLDVEGAIDNLGRVLPNVEIIL